ncbi:NAD(P)H-binding protein [Candidatus Latescibacterota bacterium]
MNIAVIGGAGVVGQAELPRLAEAGHELKGLRHRSALPDVVVTQVEGSLTDAAAVRETVEGAEVVLQMTKGGEGVAQAVEVSSWGTINILDAIGDTPSVRQVAAEGAFSFSFDIDTSHTTQCVGWTAQHDARAAIQAALEFREKRQ